MTDSPMGGEGEAAEPDGLYAPDIKPHSVEKHGVIERYAQLFVTATRRFWQCRMYLDLFAGAGMATVTNTGEVVPTSPLIALRCVPQFDRFIFCDADPRCVDALRERVRRAFPAAAGRVDFILGDSNDAVPEVFRRMPPYSKGHRVLTLCVVDPFGMRNLRFETIRRLNARFMDFLVLIPDSMDAGRGPNPEYYLRPDIGVVDAFLGDPNWRERWAEWKRDRNPAYKYRHFGRFVAERFAAAMSTLKHRDVLPADMKQIRQSGNRSPLYKLALFSKSRLAARLFKAARAEDPELDLGF